MGLEQAGFATQQRQIGINQPISKPSFLEGALGVASGALGGYRTGLTLKGMTGGGGGGLSQSPTILITRYGSSKYISKLN